MRTVKLDLSKLFGFKIVARDNTNAQQPPTIGAKIGQKAGAKIGSKIGSKLGGKVGFKTAPRLAQ